MIRASQEVGDIEVGFAIANLTQFGDDVRIEQVHQLKSVFLEEMVERGGSKGISDSPVRESDSTRFLHVPVIRWYAS